MATTPTKRLARKPVDPVAARPAALDPDDPDDDEDIEDDEDDEEENTLAAKRKKIEGSMTGAENLFNRSSNFAQVFKPSEMLQAIKFLQDKPYAQFARHWIEGTNRETGQRNVRAYTCALSFGDACPICEAGDKPQNVAAFNIALLSESGEVSLLSWEMGVRVFNVVKGFSRDPKVAPLSRHFFLVNKTGQRQQVQYNCNPVRATALTEDYQIPVPTQEALDALGLYDVSIVSIEKQSRLREVALTLSDDD